MDLRRKFFMYNSVIKRIIIFFVASLMIFCLTGCWDKNEIDDLAYVISMGLDKGIQNKIRISILIANTAKIVEGGGTSTSSGSSGTKDSDFSNIVSVEAPTIPGGLS